MMKKRILFMLIFVACGETSQPDVIKYQDLSQFYNLIRQYELSQAIKARKQGSMYAIGDRLNQLCSQIKPDEIMNDTHYRKAFLFFLEKKYLQLRREDKDARKIFYKYNAYCWGASDSFTFFALNIFRRAKPIETYSYENYVSYITDLICVDSIVTESNSYHLESLEHRRIHDSCLRFLPNPCFDF